MVQPRETDTVQAEGVQKKGMNVSMRSVPICYSAAYLEVFTFRVEHVRVLIDLMTQP